MPTNRRAASAAAALVAVLLVARCGAAEGGGWAPWYRSCLDRAGEQALLEAVADTTLYAEDAHNSNGVGEYLYAGRRDTRIHPGSLRHALVRFPTPGQDGAAPLPEGAQLTSVELTLAMSDTGTGGVPVALHRVLAAWGEGDSSGDGSRGEEGGAGALARPGDATWTVRRVEGDRAEGPEWAEPGAELAPEPSATAEVSSVDLYTWSGPGLVADYNRWLAGNGTANHGWAVVVNDGGAQSVKRFNSRQNAVSPPSLLLRYRVPAHDCAGEPPAPPAWAGGGTYAAGCAGSASGQACQLSCEAGLTRSDPEGACCRGGVWQVATCEEPCGAAQLRAAIEPAADTTLREDRPDEAGGAAAALDVAAADGAAARALLRFDVGAAPENGVDLRWLDVRRAELRLRAASGAGGDVDGPGLLARAVDSAWTEAGATWHSSQNGTAWPAAPGGGLSPNVSGSGAVGGSGTATLRGAVLTADTARWLGEAEAAGNNGWALLRDAATPAAAQSLSSREAEDQYARPRLVACYLNGPCHNGVVDADVSELCDPGEAVLAGCSDRCEVEPGHGCATPAGAATFACAALSGGSTGAFDAALSNTTAVGATIHAVDHEQGVANYVARVSAPPAVGAAHPSLRLEVLKGNAGAAEDPDEGWTGMSFAVALAPGAGHAAATDELELELGVRVPSVHCSPHLGLYELRGGKWVDAASACAGAKALRADCWLSGTLCARNGTYALRKDTAGGDPTEGGGGGGDDDSSSHHTFVIVMASLGAVFAAGVAFACWVWCSTRYRAAYKYQEDVPATTLTNVNRASLVDGGTPTA